MEEKRTQRILKEIEPEEWDWEQQPAKYYIRSTVLGGAVVTDVYDIGTKKRTYVRAGGQEIAWQNGDSGGSVVFQTADPVGASIRSAESDGDIFDAQGTESSPAELDPMGGNVATENPFVTQTGGSSCVGCGLLDETMPLWAMGGEPRITHNGFPISHEEAAMMADNGTLVMEIVHAARGRIEIFQNVPVGGILGNLVMPSRYRLIHTETWNSNMQVTDVSFLQYFQVSDGLPNSKKVEFKGLSEARMAIDHLLGLNGGKCGEMLEKLFQETGRTGTLRSKTFADLFNAVDHVLLNGNDSSFKELITSVTGHTVSLPGGGGGLAYAYPRDGKYWESGSIAFVSPFASGYSTLRPLSNSRVAGPALMNQRLIGALQQNMLRLVHELLHISVTNGSAVSHETLGNAAKTVDPDILGTGIDPETRGSSELNEFIRKHCTNFVTR